MYVLLNIMHPEYHEATVVLRKTPLFYNFRGSEISDISVVRSMPNLEVCSVRSVLLYVLKLLVN